jgi:hypothetical protein
MGRRRSRRQGSAAGSPAPDRGWLDETVDWAGAEYVARRLTGSATTKTYRCPGCDQEIRPATPHVVAWPAGDPDAAGLRRHWHSACWQARDRRASTVQRSRNAPRYG